MALIGNIAVGLTARTAKFQTGMRRARKTLQRFGKSVARVGRIVAKSVVVAFVAAAAATAYYTKNAFSAIDATAKLSDELGISTERLKGFELAAKLSGTKQEILVKGLQRLVRRMGEAKAGFGEGVKSMELLGLNAQKMGNMMPADALVVVADRISKMSNAADRAAAAYGLFGRQGQELMNFLMMGKDGLEAVQKEAERLGIAFNRVDAAQVEAANDAVTRLGAAFEGVFNVLAINLAPVLTEVVERFTAWANSGPGLAARVQAALTGVVDVVAKLTDGVNLVKVAWHSVNAAVAQFASFAVSMMAKVNSAMATVFTGMAKAAKYMPVVGKHAAKALNAIASASQAGASVSQGAANALANRARSQGALATQAAVAFSNRENSRAVAGAFADLLVKHRKTATAVAARAGMMGTGMGPQPLTRGGGAARQTDFQQVNLNRVAFGGIRATPQAKQQVTDERANMLLQRILEKMGPNSTPVTTPILQGS